MSFRINGGDCDLWRFTGGHQSLVNRFKIRVIERIASTWTRESALKGVSRTHKGPVSVAKANEKAALQRRAVCW
jgi:hypothetical protein